MKKILFYSSVNNLALFNTQKFYSIDISILESIGYKVCPTNNIFKFIFSDFDIAFIYFYRKGLIPALISKLRLKKVFFTGGIDALDKSYVSRYRYFQQLLLFKICRNLANKCLIVSESDLNNIRFAFGNKVPKKLEVVKHAIRIENFSCKFDFKKENFVTICWMESVENVKRKGVDKALLIFNQISNYPKFSNSKFYIIGKNGIGTEYLRRMADNMGITKKVVFIGILDEEEKIKILSETKYYFQLSLTEGFGLAALEALASKCIVIHSGNGGLKEIVNEDGILLNTPVFSNNFLNELLTFNPTKLDVSQIRISNNYSYNIRLEKIRSILLNY